MGPSTQVEICEVREATLDVDSAELPPNAVHVWQRRLLMPASAVEACYQLLSAEEREKALRYRVERPRSDYILTRGTLRSLIAKYLGQPSQTLVFEYTKFGKPFLADPGDLRFNVSHTDGLALIAFARNREIGVDVEKLRLAPDARNLAERFFSSHERDHLNNLSGDELDAAFFRCWTRKEAYIKAQGEGLSLPLHQFDVSIEPNEMHALLATRPDPSEASRWCVCDVPLNQEYIAALAVEVNGSKISPI